MNTPKLKDILVLERHFIVWKSKNYKTNIYETMI